jgi:hypothetical protein
MIAHWRVFAFHTITTAPPPSSYWPQAVTSRTPLRHCPTTLSVKRLMLHFLHPRYCLVFYRVTCHGATAFQTQIPGSRSSLQMCSCCIQFCAPHSMPSTEMSARVQSLFIADLAIVIAFSMFANTRTTTLQTIKHPTAVRAHDLPVSVSSNHMRECIWSMI